MIQNERSTTMILEADLPAEPIALPTAPEKERLENMRSYVGGLLGWEACKRLTDAEVAATFEQRINGGIPKEMLKSSNIELVKGSADTSN